MKQKSISIIGDGIAGLSAGCYGQMNGYRTQIFEMGDRPGGCCTSWERDGYTIDGAIHWLTGSAPGNVFHGLWQELKALEGRTIVDHEEYARIEGKDGRAFVVYSDVDRLHQHMLELAPEDSEIIAEFTDGIRKCRDFPMPIDKPRELVGPMDGIRIARQMRPYFGFVRHWEKVTIQDFAQRFSNPLLRELFPLAVNLQNGPDFPMLGFMMNLAWMDRRVAGYPVGGSLAFARGLEQRYLDLGGTIAYESRVAKILVEGDRAVGVRLADGEQHASDRVLSAADGRSTIFDMLEGRYVNGKIRSYYNNLPVSRPVIYVALGVDLPFDEVPHQTTGLDFPLENPVRIGERDRERLCVQRYNFDPTLAPPGKTVMRIYFATDYAFWKDLGQDLPRYEVEKETIAKRVIAALDGRFPGLASKVEMWDVSTPLTFERFTGNWLGTFLGWKITTKTLRLRMEKTLPGLSNFYMAGQWLEPRGWCTHGGVVSPGRGSNPVPPGQEAIRARAKMTRHLGRPFRWVPPAQCKWSSVLRSASMRQFGGVS